MVTPNKQQIIERAKELFHNEQWKNGIRNGTNPSLAELKESGYIGQAMSELMRSEGYEYQQYIEQEQAQCKTCLKHNINEGKFPLDLRECEKSNILISGTNQQGKSLCAMSISDILMRNGWQVIVFDNVGHWREKSSIQNGYVVRKKKDQIRLRIGESVVLDISLLLPRDQKKFLEQLLTQIWMFRVLQKVRQWCLIVLEEAHLYMRNIRGLVSQNLMRIASVGANWKIRTLAISPSLTGLDAEFIRLCGQRFHFKIGNEVNSKRRVRSYYGLDWARVMQELDVGFCVYVNKDKLQVWKIPLFQKRQLKAIA